MSAPIGTGDHPRTRTAPDIDRVPSWLATTASWTWRMLLVLIGVGTLLALLRELALVTIPVLLALIAAPLATPAARALQRRGVPRGAAAAIVVVGGVAALGGAVAALIPTFVRQVQELQPTIAAAFDQLFDLVEASPLNYERDQILDVFAGLGERAGEGGEVAGQVASGLLAFGQGIAALVLALVLLFFFVKDGEQIVDWVTARTPDTYRDVGRAAGHRAWFALSGYVRGTAAIALIDATIVAIALLIIGVPLVLPLTLLVFIGGFIPVIGAFVSGLVAVLVALASGGLVPAGIVLAVLVGVQQFEIDILHPAILTRRAVALHPAAVLIALTTGAVLGGIIGAFLAIPIAAVASAVANELRLRHEADGAFGTGGPAPLGPEDDPVAVPRG
jgi:putative heme transporter